MTESDNLSGFPFEEVSGRMKPQKDNLEENLFQEANLAYWDYFIEDVGARMKKEVPLWLSENKKHDEYQQRTNLQIKEL